MDGDLQRPIDAKLTVTEARDTYLKENGFTLDEYEKDAVEVNFWGFRFKVPNTPGRRRAVRWHDLHHVATGFGTDPAGEAEISAWELRRGIRPLTFYVRAIVTGGALMGIFVAPLRTWRAWQRSSAEQSLFHESPDRYDELLGLTVGELRQRLGIPPQGLADRPRALHADAPGLRTPSG